MVTRSQARRRAQYIETDNTGTQVFSTIVLPAEIKDPEALVYDASHDVFYVGGGFSPDVWVVDRSGNILQKLDVLEGYRHETNNTAVNVKDLELAPSSDPNDDPTTLNLYVADYGWSHVSDGRMLEIDLHGGLLSGVARPRLRRDEIARIRRAKRGSE